MSRRTENKNFKVSSIPDMAQARDSGKKTVTDSTRGRQQETSRRGKSDQKESI